MYRGRFAPSPTGPLHFGSLFAALISYLEARSHQGKWLLRIEDVDTLRTQTDAQQSIINTLQAHALNWDEDISYQSNHSERYEQTLAKLAASHFTFPCTCSRKQLLENNGIHLKSCGLQTVEEQYAIKYKSPKTQFTWQDGILGETCINCMEDFVLKRKEGFYAYQLAVVCDDIAQNITHVVRGSDLLDSTPMQLALYHALKIQPPKFSHFPVLLNKLNQKLSKQNFAEAVNDEQALENLLFLFKLLKLPITKSPSSTKEALEFALQVWNKHYIPAQKTIKYILPTQKTGKT